MDTNTIDLPEQLILIAAPDPKSGKLAFIKPRSPKGKDTPIAFTDTAKAQHFVIAANIVELKPQLVEIPTDEVLEGLLTSGEADLCVNPMDATEAYLHYDLPNSIERREAPRPDAVEVCAATEPLAPSLIASLRKVARQMPVVEKIWQLEIRDTTTTEPMRTLLAVKLIDGATQDDHDQTFMILGVDWCEELPRGMAVDMMPLSATPVEAGVAELEPVYVKAVKK